MMTTKVTKGLIDPIGFRDLMADSGLAIPPSGRVGQVLIKSSDDDYEVTWTNAGSGDMNTIAYDPDDLRKNVFDGLPVASMADLKALNTANVSAAFLTEKNREGRFIWREGDYSDDVAADSKEAVFVKAGDIPVSSGVWVRDLPNGLNILWFGAKGDNESDDTESIDAAFILGSRLKETIIVPAGTYLLNTDTPATVWYAPNFCSVKLRSNLTVKGVGYPVFKIKDGCSTDANPVFYSMFVGNGAYENISFEGVVFDLGGLNGANTISPDRYDIWEVTVFLNGNPGFIQVSGHNFVEGDKVVFGGTNTMPSGIVAGNEYYVRFPSGDAFAISSTPTGDLVAIGLAPEGTYNVRNAGTYNGYHCAAIVVANAPGDGIVNRMRIKDCGFINTPGVSCIIAGEGYAGFTVISEDVVIEDCWFHNNGLDSFDHSSIYLWANNSKVINCRFTHPTPSQGVKGPVCAIELHGRGNRAIGNYVHNYLQGIYICATSFGVIDDNIVRDNILRVVWRGVDTWSVEPTDNGLQGTLIGSNAVTLLPVKLISSRPSMPKAAIALSCHSKTIGPFWIEGNILRSDENQGSVGIFAYTSGTGRIEGIHISGGTIYGFSRGIVATGISSSIRDILVEGVSIKYLVSSPTYTTIGIYISSGEGKVTVRNNIIGDEPGPAAGILLPEMVLTHLDMDGNVIKSPSPIFDTARAYDRTGIQATTFTHSSFAVDVAARWLQPPPGAIAYCNYSEELGLDGSKFTIDGWRKTTTVWVERRSLTGN